MSTTKVLDELDLLRTFKEAATITGMKYWQIQRAVKAGLLPSYRLFSSKKYVRVRDILELASSST